MAKESRGGEPSVRSRNRDHGLLVLAAWFQVPGDLPKPRELPPLWPQILGTWLERPSFNQFPIMNLRSPVACLFPAFPVMTQADAYCAITGLSGESKVKMLLSKRCAPRCPNTNMKYEWSSGSEAFNRIIRQCCVPSLCNRAPATWEGPWAQRRQLLLPLAIGLLWTLLQLSFVVQLSTSQN
nr:PREDICTED: lymphocyte antigen 6L isoform X2 [Rhinolophus sinicus]